MEVGTSLIFEAIRKSENGFYSLEQGPINTKQKADLRNHSSRMLIRDGTNYTRVGQDLGERLEWIRRSE